jgi:hypothetical protein
MACLVEFDVASAPAGKLRKRYDSAIERNLKGKTRKDAAERQVAIPRKRFGLEIAQPEAL